MGGNGFYPQRESKKVRSAPDHMYIDTVPYRKNLSVRRLYSQYDFARKAEKILEKEQADMVYMYPSGKFSGSWDGD